MVVLSAIFDVLSSIVSAFFQVLGALGRGLWDILGAVASVPVFALVYFLLSLPFAWLFSHIPGVGRWLAD